MGMLVYNICFIRRGDHVLLMNRNKAAWMGRWNGIGGKLLPGESPRASVLREVLEETGIRLTDASYKGMVTWSEGNGRKGGMYLYTATLDDDYPYPTPVRADEGLLDWKRLDWIVHPDNEGVASNIPSFLPLLLEDEQCYEHECLFEEKRFVSLVSRPIPKESELSLAPMAELA
ncbi:8-oxo-dGTP diphosphatase [Paenibacillus sp. YYML68]|uniref:NUDIX hydrolase n=1 Tax=Paenibacillus sp. YYML68 TaxID=2909250 RepID=UPI0024910FC8|nr:8-oxo-dGTP diphosphatase [Paenibacillus sp. YYML68]